MQKKISNASAARIIFFVIILTFPLGIRAQETEGKNYERDTIIAAATEMMQAARYCALITIDHSGHPQVRTMDPFSPDENMHVWMGTNINSRKVSEIRDDSRVTLYYEAPNGTGYVVIQGNAHLIEDQEATEKYWKEEWEAFYPDKNSTYMLIKVIPRKLEIIDYKYNITGSPITWEVPYLEF